MSHKLKRKGLVSMYVDALKLMSDQKKVAKYS